MDSGKSINSFEIKRRIGHLIIYQTIFFVDNLLMTFQHFYYAKNIFLESLIWFIFFTRFSRGSTDNPNLASIYVRRITC